MMNAPDRRLTNGSWKVPAHAAPSVRHIPVSPDMRNYNAPVTGTNARPHRRRNAR